VRRSRREFPPSKVVETDPEGAEVMATMRSKLFDLSDEDFDLLYTACAYHTDGLVEVFCLGRNRNLLPRAAIPHS
jgi:hypothetical protein